MSEVPHEGKDQHEGLPRRAEDGTSADCGHFRVLPVSPPHSSRVPQRPRLAGGPWQGSRRAEGGLAADLEDRGNGAARRFSPCCVTKGSRPAVRGVGSGRGWGSSGVLGDSGVRGFSRGLGDSVSGGLGDSRVLWGLGGSLGTQGISGDSGSRDLGGLAVRGPRGMSGVLGTRFRGSAGSRWTQDFGVSGI